MQLSLWYTTVAHHLHNKAQEFHQAYVISTLKCCFTQTLCGDYTLKCCFTQTLHEDYTLKCCFTQTLCGDYTLCTDSMRGLYIKMLLCTESMQGLSSAMISFLCHSTHPPEMGINPPNDKRNSMLSATAYFHERPSGG